MQLTVFTPTYNRSYTLTKLYDSLLKQINQDFEWLIVDDGSTDDTRALVEGFVEERKIKIEYYLKVNGGKHTAINYGVRKAKGELFFIVDSDDTLTPNAVKRILFHWKNVSEDTSFAGVSGNRAYPSGEAIGGDPRYDVLDVDALNFRVKHHIAGDKAEVYKTTVLLEYPFPETEKEKFCPEALIWNRIAQKYKLRYFNENIYICEYLEGGLTSNIIKLRMYSPINSMLAYTELSGYNIPISQKLKAGINFWRFSFNSSLSFAGKLKLLKNKVLLTMIPFGYLFYLRDKMIVK